MNELIEYKKLLEILIHPEKPHRAMLSDEVKAEIAKVLSKFGEKE